METLAERLRDQQGRHQGGSKWIGTAGTSPFGAYGYNPEGVRIGQDERRARPRSQGLGPARVPQPRRQRRARHPQHQARAAPPAPLGPRGRGGRARPRRHHPAHRRAGLARRRHPAPSGATRSRSCSSSTSAARWTRTSAWSRSCSPPPGASSSTWSIFYFHNCLYESVWRDNRRRWDAQTPTAEILRTYGPDYRAIFVGDAAMSPYEITHPGGANEHWNAESGEVWLRRLLEAWPHAIWINPTPRGGLGLIRSRWR